MKIRLLAILLILQTTLYSQYKVEKYNGANNEIYEVYNLDESQLKSGEYKYYFDDKLLVSGDFLSGKKNNKWLLFDYNGNVILESFYENDKKTGEWKYYINNQLICNLNYTEDVLDGISKSYYKSGKEFLIRNYNSNKLNGKQLQFYENGNVFSEINFINGIKNGPAKYYYNNGNLLEEINYKYGKIDGLYRLYHENGNIFSEVLFLEGNKNTLISMRDIDGNHIEAGNLKNGEGIIKIFYLPDSTRNLNIFEYKEYINGKPSGKYYQYDTEGNILIRGKYKNGFKVGYWVYNKENNRVYKRKYKLKEEKYDIDNVLNIIIEGESEISYIKSEFPGGEERMQRFIAQNIYYPENAIFKKINGKVLIGFFINEIGEIHNIRTVFGLDSIIDNSSINAVKKMPYWTPAFNKGFPIKSYQQLPIIFKK